MYDPFHMERIHIVGIPPANSKLEAIYECVVEFIKWKNKQNGNTHK